MISRTPGTEMFGSRSGATRCMLHKVYSILAYKDSPQSWGAWVGAHPPQTGYLLGFLVNLHRVEKEALTRDNSMYEQSHANDHTTYLRNSHW